MKGDKVMTNLIKKNIYLWFGIVSLFGLVIFFIGREVARAYQILGEIMELLGMALFSVFGVSILYERFMAQQHFKKFNKKLRKTLSEMDSIQGKCRSLGIEEIFDSTDSYRQKYPLMNIVEQSTGTITCVGMTLFNLFNMTNEIRKGLEKGLNFKFASVDPCAITDHFKTVTGFDIKDVEVALNALERDFINWAKEEKEKPKGTIEFRYHCIPFFDTGLMYTDNKDKEKLVWSLSFGRDMSYKIVMILNTELGLGAKLKQRYMKIYDNAIPQEKYSYDCIVNSQKQDQQELKK